jgi:hypothetical protein
MRTVDLDLLAGSSYREMYSLSSASAVTAEAVSNRGIVQGSQPALSWYMAAAPPTVTIANTAGDPVTAKIAVFGPKGAVRARGTFQLQPFLRQDLSLPVSSGAGPLSLSVQATGPVVVAGAKGAVTNPVSQPQNTWYAVRPNAAPISVFNPDAHKPAQVDVQFVGSAVKSEQLQVGPHHAFVLPSGDAAAVVIRADEGVTAGYTRHTASAGALAMQPSSQAAVEAAGNVTQVALFNPSTKTAHVTLSIVGEGSASRIAGTLAPSQVVALRVRTAVSPARGVEVNSDVPVVATPAS